jgi:hypothetical protein
MDEASQENPQNTGRGGNRSEDHREGDQDQICPNIMIISFFS